MSKRITGRRGKIMAQTSSTLILMKALTDSSDHKTYTSGNAYWLEDVALNVPDVRLDGVISGLSVNPTANVDEVQVEAGSAQFAGVETAVPADLSVAVSRPGSSGQVIVNSIVVDSAGAITNIAGTAGTSGGARGAAGGPAFITVGSLLLATVVLTQTSAIVLASEINNDVAERYDMPSYKVDYLDGKVKFQTALEAIHTSSVTRKVYAQYRYAILSDIGDLFQFSVDLKTDAVNSEAFDDEWKEIIPNVKGWSGSFGGYRVNKFWFSRASKVDGSIWVLKFYNDRQQVEHLVGRAHLDWGLSVSKDATVNETITFTGTGELKHRDA